MTTLPRPLPASLRRLLVYSNHLETVQDADTFPVRSQLTTLSLAGNQIHRVSSTVLQRLTNLQSLDLSNNQLRRIDTATFSANTQLRSLTLAKNPLHTIETGVFDGLRSLRALTLSYVPTVDVQLSAEDLFRPLSRLTRLDFDNSPGVVKAVLWTPVDNDSASNVEELGLVNCGLTTLPRDFPRRFPRLSALRISSSRWHCDRALMWFRDWLLDPGVDVRVQSLPDTRCATPRSVRHRPLVSLNDDEFVETTWTPRPRPTSTSLTTTTAKNIKTKIHTSPTQPIDKIDDKSTVSPLHRADSDDVIQGLTSTEHASIGGVDDVDRAMKSSSKRLNTVISSQSTASLLAVDHRQSSLSPRPRHNVNHYKQLYKFDTRLVVVVITVGVTLVVAIIIVAAIFHFWCRSHKPPRSSTPLPPSLFTAAYDDDTLITGTAASLTPRTFIKYKNKNGVLFFSTPTDLASTLTTTAAPDDATPESCLIGETGADGIRTTAFFRYIQTY